MPRVLGGGALVVLGIGAIIGTGIWVLTGTAAANQAGPAVILSFIISGVASVLAGLAYAELAAMFPVAGSAYSYARESLGDFFGWLVGWTLILEYLIAAAIIAVGWSAYINSLALSAGIELPPAMVAATFAQDPQTFGVVFHGPALNLPAIFIVMVMTAICYLGVKLSSVFNAVIVSIKLAAIILVIAFGAFYIDPANWVPFLPENTGRFGEFGWSGVGRGAAIVFFAYVGFDAVSTAAQEAKNPQKDMPIGIIGSLVICGVLYILVAAVVTGMAPYTLLNTAAPVATALDMHPPLAWLSAFTKVGALAGMTSALLVMVLAQARILYAMAGNKQLPGALSRLHPRYGTPGVATLIVGALAALLAGLFPIQILSEMVSIGTLLVLALVCGCVMLLRVKRPDLHRPFKVPALWFTCPAGIIICLGMMLTLPGPTWIRLLVWTAIGMAIYAVFHRKAAAPRKT